MQPIPFNKPYFTGRETEYVQQAMQRGKVGGDGYYTHQCQAFFQQRYGFAKCLLTTSCTDALEIAAILLDIQPGDEVIVPSYTFVSTVNAFMLRGAKPIFIDSETNNPNLDAQQLEVLITPRTKAIVAVHYAGAACDMDAIAQIASKHNITVVEDAALAIDSYYKGRPLGSIGALAAFSFHESKNITSGEGGMLVINDEKYIKRAEIIREKGTNRSAFFRGEVDKYNWVDIGSSFLPSDIIAAFLYAQLESIEDIQHKRKQLWHRYRQNLAGLQEKNLLTLPFIPDYASNNAHMFYLVAKDVKEREQLIDFLKQHGIYAVFHYISLHTSNFYVQKYDERVTLPQSDRYTDCLIRLPLFYELTFEQVDYISAKVAEYFNQAK